MRNSSGLAAGAGASEDTVQHRLEARSEHPACSSPAKLTVQFRDGQTVEAGVDHPKGHPKNPMTEAEFAAKTKDCVAFAARPLPPDTPNRLISTVGELERLADISELVGVVTATPD